MNILSKEQVKRLHSLLLEKTGGLDGVRDEAMLDSALANPFQTFDGVELYPSTAAKIARMAFSLVCNHPFIDGNKRIGTYVMLVLLEINHIEVDFSDAEIVRIGLSLADGGMDDKQLLDLILTHFEDK
ncbi:MAG: type II toxin-antitoxin system death-on-curing family toxin [Acidobacteriota bacterium]|jgi:death-on-curing protein|nr:type II toxin-antitoxin system death-on-curing family toxin [Acidobacteriota bacterium]